MALKVTIRPQAEADLQEVFKWYLSEKRELAEAFLFEFHEAVKAVSETPRAFPKRYKSVRAFALKRFPYNIYFLI